MARTAGDLDGFPVLAAKQDVIILMAHIAIGASGAPTVSNEDGTVTFTRTGAGTYTVVYPAFAGAAFFFIQPRKTATILEVAATAIDTAAGTATVVTRDAAAAAADAANGDILQLIIIGKRSTAK